MKIISMELEEALRPNTYSEQPNLCNIYVGKFQPFTEAHLNIMKEVVKSTGVGIHLIVVRRKDPILSEELTQKMVDKLVASKIILSYSFVNRWTFPIIFNIVRAIGIEPFKIICGEDREKDYRNQLEFSKANDYVFREDTDLWVFKRTDEDISATKVRESILNGDVEYLRESFPKMFLSFIPLIKKELEKK